MSAENYLELNKESWNKRTAYHVTSDFYQMDAFKAGKTSLMDIELRIIRRCKREAYFTLTVSFWSR